MDYTSLIFINVRDTKEYWKKTERYDRAKDRVRIFYEVDVFLSITLEDARQYILANIVEFDHQKHSKELEEEHGGHT